jgi:hypothetical protein
MESMGWESPLGDLAKYFFCGWGWVRNWRGRAEWGLAVALWLALKPDMDWPLIVVLLLRSLAGGEAGFGPWSG